LIGRPAIVSGWAITSLKGKGKAHYGEGLKLKGGEGQINFGEDKEPSQDSRGATWTPLEKTDLVKAILPKHKELYGNFKGSTALTAETKDIE
jgi:hypothetical protein